MARGDKGSILDGFHGRLNEHIVIKQRNGKPVLCFYPQGKKVKWTENQKIHRQRFKDATAYAKQVMKNPDRLAFYRTYEQDGINAANLAIRDYMHEPEINSIDIRKSRKTDQYLIRVHATDNFIITKVDIALRDLSGKFILATDANQFRHTTLWLLKIDIEQLCQVHTIRVRAHDYTGNITVKDHNISPREAMKWIHHSHNKATG